MRRNNLRVDRPISNDVVVSSGSRTPTIDDPLCLVLGTQREFSEQDATALIEDGLALPEESAAELAGQVIGRFRLEAEIARGGMGIILQSRDTELDREIAVKLLLKRHLGKAHIHQQFTNEARITGRLQHPGIVPIYETGSAFGNRPYFAMKLVRGQTLSELLAQRKSLEDDLPRLLKIFEKVCQTLSYTHSQGVMHLDIKPSNIMIGAFGEVHLMDWGLARITAENCVPMHPDYGQEGLGESVVPANVANAPIALHDLSVNVPAGAIWGTPAYMSPEQARGHCVDVRSDVFGLGSILCEILTGAPPYRGTKLVDVCYQAAKADLCGIFAELTDCGAPEALIRLAIRCLSPDPEARPRDAWYVAQELTLYLESRLQSAQNDLERFFELSLDLFCIAGLDGYFRRVNSNFPRILGYSEKELLSRPFLDFVHPEDQEETVVVMSKLRAGQPVVQFKNRYHALNDSWRYLEWTAKSLPNEELIFAVARDVTERMTRTGEQQPGPLFSTEQEPQTP